MVFAAIASNLSRSAPFLNISLDEVDSNKHASWSKEFEATQGVDRLPVIDYSIWFSAEGDSHLKPLSPFLPAAPHHNLRIKNSLAKWKSSMVNKLLYPQVQSGKSLSRMTAATWYSKGRNEETGDFPTNVSSADLEKWYADTGEEIEGPCEMRQSWKYNDLTPRTYFAQGGSAYHASKYIRDIATSLSNMFPETGFISRFSYNDLEVSEQHTTFIYDYSSFTSNLTELKYFLQALSEFVDDVMVRIVDSRHGVLHTSLGALIRDYNDVCNQECEFMRNRWMEDDTAIYRHNKAGLLGVYGNIALSTVLHGLHACQLAGDASSAKCVGDDVYGSYKVDAGIRSREIIDAIQSLGEIQKSKIRWWRYRPIEDESGDDRAYPYIKRPFDRLETRMILEPALYLPIFGLINPIPDGVHTDPEDLATRIKILCVQTYACIRQIRVIMPSLRVLQILMVENYIRCLYRAIGLELDGRLPVETFYVGKERFSGLFVPKVDGNFLMSDPWDLLAERFGSHESTLIRLPMMYRDKDDCDEEVLRGEDWCTTTMSRLLSYLKTMDWLEVEQLHEERFMTYVEYKDFYDALFAGDLYNVYRVRLRRLAPKWLKHVVV